MAWCELPGLPSAVLERRKRRKQSGAGGSDKQGVLSELEGFMGLQLAEKVGHGDPSTLKAVQILISLIGLVGFFLALRLTELLSYQDLPPLAWIYGVVHLSALVGTGYAAMVFLTPRWKLERIYFNF